MKIGDIIVRKSYQCDLMFTVNQIKGNEAILHGMNYRLIADAPLEDLELVETRQFKYLNWFQFNQEGKKEQALRTDEIKSFHYQSTQSNEKMGRVLHLDGNQLYFKRCSYLYESLNMNVDAYYIKEELQSQVVLDLLKKHHPTILILTGHDAINKTATDDKQLTTYKNTGYFIDAIKVARMYNPNFDELVIFAGGCQSYYEELMKAGANFATAPQRRLINVQDPVYIAHLISTTPVTTYLNQELVLKNDQLAHIDFGGIETRGQCRQVITLNR